MSVYINGVSILEGRLTAARAGYLDNINQAGLLQLTAARAGYLNNIDNVVLKTLAAMRGTDGAAVASSWTPTRAGYMDALNRDRPSMLFPSALAKAIIAVPIVGNVADLDFPDVAIAGLPSGITIKRADLVLIIGALLDTSTAENQIAAADKKLRIKISTGAWATDDIPALTFVQNSLQVDGSAYRGGTVLFGGIDIKAIITIADGTYNLRSVQTTREDAVIATGDTLELLDVTAVIRVWFN